MIPKFERPVWLDLHPLGGIGAEIMPLLELEAAEFRAVLGYPLIFERDRDDRMTDVWNIVVDSSVTRSRLTEGPGRRLELTLPSASDFVTGLNLLHTLAYSPSATVVDDEAGSYPEAFDRIYDEIYNIYPYLELRGLDWAYATARHQHVRELEGAEFWQGAQKWVAELGDAHTKLIFPESRYHPPYLLEMMSEGAVLRRVPRDSDAWRAGVRVGDRVDVDDLEERLRMIGASPQHHALVAGRRFLSMSEEKRRFSARRADGSRRVWTEQRRPYPGVTVVGDVVKISVFTPDVPDQLRLVLGEMKGKGSATLDLRGNTGGSLLAAAEARRLFVREEGVFGSVAFTTGRGSLAAAESLTITPAPDAWQGRVRVLVDSMTYSASEDFLHPLVGADHVTIIGGPTGGGSGRPHTRLLKDRVSLATSTAITYTRTGQPIEFLGIQDQG